MSVILQAGLTSCALSFFTLLAQCAPLDEQIKLSRRGIDRELLITQTIVSTFTETSTSTTFTTVVSSSSPGVSQTTSSVPSSATPSPTGEEHSETSTISTPEAILFLPPDALPSLSPPSKLGKGDPGASPASAPSSTSGQTPSAMSEPTPAPASGAPIQPQVMAYYPDWAADSFPPEKIDFSRLDWIDFAFAVPDQNFQLTWDGSDDAPELLNRLVASAHASGKKVKLSVGGWTGSKYFSMAVSNAANRQQLASNILSLYNQFDLDGIDIDWEYPGQNGNDGNRVSPDDSAHFLSFLQTLRSTLPPTAKITAATMTVPFADSEGNPIEDVSEFAKVLDWILVMNYDTWGSSSSPGPNAPLNDACQNSTQADANALTAVKTWTSAGFPASQIVLGVPSYGYISRSGATSLRTRRSQHRRRSSRHSARHIPIHELTEVLSDATDSSPASPSEDLHEDAVISGVVLATNEDGGTDNGQVQFRELVRQGVLEYIPAWDAAETALNNVNATTLTFAGRQIGNFFMGFSEFERHWDDCSNTPYLRSGNARQVISYDDPQSLEMKAMLAKEAGLLGVNMFDVHGDTDHWDLTDGIRRGLGL